MTAGTPGPQDAEATARVDLLSAMCRLDALGLNRGSTGNASLRFGDGMLVTPSGMGAGEMTVDDLVWLGDDGRARGPWAPSSEWHFHRAIHAARPDLPAVLHTHSVNATALACLGRPLPPFHYMVAVAGGADVPCVPYHLFGSASLSQAVATAMRDRRACLLAHHGLVAAGATVAEALKLAIEIEALCETFLKLLPMGEPRLLDAAQMDEVIAKFRGYGRAARAGSSPASS